MIPYLHGFLKHSQLIWPWKGIPTHIVREVRNRVVTSTILWKWLFQDICGIITQHSVPSESWKIAEKLSVYEIPALYDYTASSSHTEIASEDSSFCDLIWNDQKIAITKSPF